MGEFCVNGVLKGRDSHRIERRAVYEVTISYLPCALSELVSRHVAAEIVVEQVRQQQSFGAELSTAVC